MLQPYNANIPVDNPTEELKKEDSGLIEKEGAKHSDEEEEEQESVNLFIWGQW